MFSPDELWALRLSLFAGLSTTIGGLLAIVRQPDDAALAFLLGAAIGVMALLSVAEMWLHAALSHGWPGVTAAFAAGAGLYRVAQPLLPDFAFEKALAAADDAAAAAAPAGRGGKAAAAAAERKAARRRSAELLRLGLLMALTMTLHNLPEGLAVAFSAGTDFGPVMAAAIAVHNVPEGLVVAAPVYAATGSRLAALGAATASGLSEPLGALLALAVAKPLGLLAGGGGGGALHLVLAGVGGVMAAVCALELWPEGRRCRAPGRLAAGAALGGAAMGWTLWVGV